jgi:nucleotide-binding universal stress UspA family protein
MQQRREITMRKFRRILVPVDGSATSNKALVTALDIARDSDSHLKLIHVVDELAYVTGFEASGQVLALVREGGQRVLAESADIAKSAGVPADTHLIDEPGRRLGEMVCNEASEWKADLIVVGTHGRRGMSRVLLGSGAEQIIRMSPVPTLVVRSDEKD